MTYSSYHVIENYISPKACQQLLTHLMGVAEPDGKENFRYAYIGASDFLNAPPPPWDKDHLLTNAAKTAEKFFLDNYEMHGKFIFERIYGNIMDPGSYLPSHRDEDANKEGVFDGKKRSHVAGLFLNDDYEGGEIVFEDQGVALRPKPGTLVFFPGYYTNHGVNELISGTRVNVLMFFYDTLAD